ncbi:N-methyl-D-aspartate receptor NMDAR2C subunit [Nodosilinea sp. FACHB-131]|uniref:HD domain-containing protein n=1 Tax=Cyanophyceae TaxID=3028117 RepID=UPI001681F3CE|nr:N-methyl-D-aspartate receptor NMDAR2C subunit [Nodosilinea sp. FACHB-131]MBD1872005.1 N-methyl-D-aspartate receptor NMDAR2C subunit [Nodosilinea sp. FACHB-131]
MLLAKAQGAIAASAIAPFTFLGTDSWAKLGLGLLRTVISARWSALWHKLNLPVPKPTVLSGLCDRYSEPQRAYHTLQHLIECLDWCDQTGDLAENSAVVELALWFHDAVYETHRADNEQQSADLAVQVIDSVGGEDLLQRSVHDLILATKHDAIPSTVDMGLVVDIDLAVLGAEVDRFAQYDAQIRQEYAWVPEDVFCQKRAEILQSFLNRPAIFTTNFFQERLEHQAQRNLHRSLTVLMKGSG